MTLSTRSSHANLPLAGVALTATGSGSSSSNSVDLAAGSRARGIRLASNRTPEGVATAGGIVS